VTSFLSCRGEMVLWDIYRFTHMIELDRYNVFYIAKPTHSSLPSVPSSSITSLAQSTFHPQPVQPQPHHIALNPAQPNFAPERNYRACDVRTGLENGYVNVFVRSRTDVCWCARRWARKYVCSLQRRGRNESGREVQCLSGEVNCS
jgi:hypothetical protein